MTCGPPFAVTAWSQAPNGHEWFSAVSKPPGTQGWEKTTRRCIHRQSRSDILPFLHLRSNETGSILHTRRGLRPSSACHRVLPFAAPDVNSTRKTV